MRSDPTRRRSLAAGASVLAQVMTGVTPFRTDIAQTAEPVLPMGSGDGRSVLIPGAGIAGLTAAYEMRRAGFRVQVLEAQGLYLNLGAGRLPHHHRRVLRYCAELGAALEPYIMETTADLVQSPQGSLGKPQVNRRVANDTRGHLAELLTRVVQRGALDQDLTAAERSMLTDLLRTFGDLQRDGTR